ncbi:MAG TPA: hypothetical protein P5265_07495, partial [Bacteroidia bacterium]|nr:hypothetical protein [Bacteroidia bacterium]
MDNILAKANDGFIYPPAKAGGIKINRNAALAHSIGGNFIHRNAALAHSIESNFINRNAALAHSI